MHNLKELWDYVQSNAVFSNYVSGLLAALTIAIIVGVRRKWFSRIAAWWRPSVSLSDFSLREIKDRKGYFIPNNITVDGKLITENSLDFFFHTLLKDTYQQFYVIVGPTGMGKTTFLCNIFLHYAKTSKRNNVPGLLFGKMHTGDTNKSIEQIRKKGQASNTILLLDALDEFNSDSTSSDAYTQEIVGKISGLQEYKDFQKVIFTVRQQFDELQRVRKMIIYNKNLCMLDLQPFTETQVLNYVQTRYQNENFETRNGITNLIEVWIFKKYSFVSIPMVLGYLKEIWETQAIQTVSILAQYDVYKIIEQKWFEREAAEKRWGEGYKRSVTKFCRQLAFVIYSSPQGREIINVKDIKAFEELYFGDYNHALGDRSLLVKETKVVNGRSEEYLKFIHRSFLEYFLVEYEENKDPDDESVDFTHLSFAIPLYIGLCWRRSKVKAVTINNQSFETEFEKIETWVKFFDEMLPNESLRRVLVRDMDQILSREDPGWRSVLSSLENLRVTVSLWNEVTSKPSGIYAKGIQYLKPFITAVDLVMPRVHGLKHSEDVFESSEDEFLKIGETDLACFDTIKTLRFLRIEGALINSMALNFFSESVVGLESLILNMVKIEEGSLQIFAAARNLKVLQLSGIRLTPIGLAHFAGTVHTLEEVSLAKNKIIDEHLEIFKDCCRLKLLYLSQNQLDGTGLRYFNNSIKSLEELTVDNNKIVDENLSCFKNASKIKVLHLHNNKLLGPALEYFHQCIDRLEELTIWENEIDSGYLHPFTATNQTRKYLFIEKSHYLAELIFKSTLLRFRITRKRYKP